MEYLNQRILRESWDTHVPGRCTMTGCSEPANGLCEEHTLLVDAVVEDMMDLDLTREKIMLVLEQLGKRMSRSNNLYFYTRDGRSDFFNAKSSYDIILFMIEKGEIDISVFKTREGLRKCLKNGDMYSIPSGDLDHIVICSLQRKIKELYSHGLINHVY